MAERISADPAHDIHHIRRVVANAKAFSEQEGACAEVVIPAAWLHDCVSLPKDSPRRDQASRLAAQEAHRFLTAIDYPDRYLDAIGHAIEAHSYSAGIPAQTLEAKIVQDADRIDAIGAIGISRCLLVGGALNRTLYCADDPLCENREPDDGRYTIDHFYEKLFKLEPLLNTDAARQEARRRLAFMRSFLNQLAAEIHSAGRA